MKIIAILPAYLLALAIFTVPELYSHVYYNSYNNGMPGSDPSQREELYNNLVNKAGIKSYRAKPTYNRSNYSNYNGYQYNNSGNRVYSNSRVNNSGRTITTDYYYPN